MNFVYARELLSITGLDPSGDKKPVNSGVPIVKTGGITTT